MRESSLCCQTCDGGALTTQNEGPGFISTMEITPQKRFCDSRFGSVSHTPVLSELIDNQQSMSSEQGSPFKFLWQFRYPFAYWDNRLEKINPYNEQDRLEALYSLVQLTDIYAHIFAAYVRNPEQPWFFVKENTFRGISTGSWTSCGQKEWQQ